MSEIDYEKIRQENIKKYGTASHHLAYFADIYSTRTHFIFEVLQNAEDALSRRELSDISGYVHFDLHSDKLEIRHNGKPFDERNVIGICGIGEGTKAGDYTQIGKFGIGFKSVYAYSFFPEIHSENEHFKIERFVEPHAIEAITSKDTLIVLPFDQPENRPEWAFRDNINADSAVSEISLAISKLDIRTLLFLQHIEKIEWTLPNEKGFLTRKTKSKNKKSNWRIVEVSDHLGKIEQWQIFSKKIDVTEGDKKHQATIEIAFLLEKGKVIKANDTELVISFPTEKKTELGFLIQAPFKATKSRDNIKSDDAVNHQMIKVAAQLVMDSLLILRDSKKLTVASYNALPLDEGDFPENSFFRPIYNQVREALKTQDLLPAQNGSFIKANEAKLARGKDLVDLFLPKQLGALFNKKQLFWLDASITSDKSPDIHTYLIELVADIQVTADNLAPKLTADFFSKQPLNWLIQFILYAENGAKILRETPFIRLQSGKQVGTVRSEPNKPTAWFAPDKTDQLDLPNWSNVVHSKLASNDSVKKFLIKEGIPEIEIEHIVVNRILPKYKDSPDFDTEDYLKDLQKIAKAYVNGNDHTKEWLEENLNETAWLACIKFGGNETEIFWKKPKSNLFDKPSDIEIPSSIAEDSQVYFLHSIFEHELLNQYQSFKEFLNECVHKLDTAAIVEKFILPKYPLKTFNEEEYRTDLQWILKSPNIVRYSSSKWLACVHASGNLKTYYVNPNPQDTNCCKVYTRNEKNKIWFTGLENIGAYFLHPIIEETLGDKFISDVIKPISELTKNLHFLDYGKVKLTSWNGYHKQGLEGFKPDAEIIGLEKALTDWNIDRCLVLWNILLQAPRIISGYTQSETNRQRLDAADRKLEYTEAGKLLCNSKYKWLPDKQGNWHKPSELLLTDLPDEFETSSISAKEVTEKLGMKKPEVEQAINIIAGDDPNKIKQLELFMSASDAEREKMLKIIPQEVPPQPAPAFKDGISQLSRRQKGSISPNEADDENDPIQKIERYQNKLNQSVEENLKQHLTTPQTTQFSLVSHTPSNKAAREFLYAEYKGRCQITGDTFPKASANANGEAENYFEACSLLSYSNADYLNNEGNMLCVSADTMAKLKNASFDWLDDLENLIKNFESRTSGEMTTSTIKIRLAGEECQITWSERHFARLVALWNKA